MIYLRLALVVAALCPVAATADDKPREADGPVAVELTRAKQKYQSAVEKAGEKLLAAFADQQKRAEARTSLKADQQIKLLEQLRGERAAFEADPANLPKSLGMAREAGNYQTTSSIARRACEGAFDRAAESYRSRKELAAAKAVLDEKRTFFLPAIVRSFVGTYRWINGLTVVIAADRTALASNGDASVWFINEKRECVLGWKSGFRNVMRLDGESTDLIGDGGRATRLK